MAAISVILFDLNSVLYRYDREARIACLTEVAGRSPDAAKAAVWDLGYENSGDAGAMDAAAYLRGFEDRLGYELREANWIAAQMVAATPIAATMALLPRLRPDVVTPC